jgi:hypothetical protein
LGCINYPCLAWYFIEEFVYINSKDKGTHNSCIHTSQVN